MQPILETKRIILRKGTEEDIDIIADSRNTPFVMRYNLYGISTPDNIRTELKTYETLVLVSKGSNQPIGCIYVKNDDFRYHVNSMEISCWLTEKNSAQGIMSEVGPSVLYYYLFEQNIDRLTARIFSPNIASVKLVEKLGFKQEGFLKQAVKNKDGKVFDLYLYSISKEDYTL